jgi:hypothetical protein
MGVGVVLAVGSLEIRIRCHVTEIFSAFSSNFINRVVPAKQEKSHPTRLLYARFPEHSLVAIPLSRHTSYTLSLTSALSTILSSPQYSLRRSGASDHRCSTGGGFGNGCGGVVGGSGGGGRSGQAWVTRPSPGAPSWPAVDAVGPRRESHSRSPAVTLWMRLRVAFPRSAMASSVTAQARTTSV